ncbi:MAG: lipoprotein, partial [Leptospira sp.]|nr:lipoprotein [Leptospira sp.]
MKNNKFTLLAILSICVFIFSDCFLLGAKGEFKYADIKTSRKGKVLIGFIENRDLKYSPYNTKNLTDLLKFEIMNQGYEAYTIDDKPQQAVVTENSSELKPEEKSPEENTNGIRNIAGESDRNLL